jgi:hypothetical protein
VARFANLERNPHNNLRLSRILVSLGELGFGRYKVAAPPPRLTSTLTASSHPHHHLTSPPPLTLTLVASPPRHPTS